MRIMRQNNGGRTEIRLCSNGIQTTFKQCAFPFVHALIKD